MTDWAKLARAQGLDLPAQEADRVAQALGALERSFRPLTDGLPPELEPASVFQAEEE